LTAPNGYENPLQGKTKLAEKLLTGLQQQQWVELVNNNAM
jgi:hypothetical protein